MDMVPYTLVQKIKNEFQVTLEAFRSNKVFENKLNELLKDVQENNMVISVKFSNIQSFFDQLSTNIDSNKSNLQKTLEDRDEYKFKAESLERNLSQLQKEICQLKTTERKPTYNANYSEKELDFLHQENSKLVKREKDLQKQINNYKEMEGKLHALTNENEYIKKCNVENQTKIVEREIEIQKKVLEYESTISKQNQEIKNLSEELKGMKTELILIKESQLCTQCGIHRPQLLIEDASNSTCHVVKEKTVDILEEMKGVAQPESNEENRHLSPSENSSFDLGVSECSKPTPYETVERRPQRSRKEVNYREVDDTKPRRQIPKKIESGENITQRISKAQKKRIQNEKDGNTLKSKANEEQDGKAASAEGDMNIQNMDPNIEEELAIRRVASEDKFFKKPTALKKRNMKESNSVLSLVSSLNTT